MYDYNTSNTAKEHQIFNMINIDNVYNNEILNKQ